MLPPVLTVYFWPELADDIPVNQSLIVIAVRTLPTTLRSQARKLIRMAITQVLADKLCCPYAKIKLTSQSGQSVKVSQPRQNIGLSISHEPGLSLAAINMNGKVGVDLIDVKSIPNDNEIYKLALEYLGTQVAEYLSLLPSELQKHAFAKAWAEFEARLKCQGESLDEWTASSALQLNTLTFQPLELPESYIGAVVFSDSINSEVLTTSLANHKQEEKDVYQQNIVSK